MPPNSFARCNNNLGKTPKEVFKDTHKKLVKDGSKWLAKTSVSCSVMLVVITSFAFSASSTVPGGLDQVSGKPLLQDDLAFNIFAISSMVALCFSITALLIFLTILTSRFQEKEFSKDLPRNLLMALLSMFISVVSILISFCSGHLLVLKDELRSSACTLYAGTCLPMLYFALAQLPLYYDLVLGIFKTVPQRGYKVFSH